MRLEVLISQGPRHVQRVWVDLAEGATVAQALAAAHVAGDAQGQASPVGLWGRAVSLRHVVRPGDRLEVYRPLQADPKEARRQRFAAQKAQRPHAKSGRPL